MPSIILFLSMISAAYSIACDNGCSGHGTCLLHGVCECWDNWGVGLSHLSGDCSERICPYELAWVDNPNVYGTRHRYAECANRGVCNRDSGECECFPGYEGKGCQRSVCPNDCSGHGRCQFEQEMFLGSVPEDYGIAFPSKNIQFFQDEKTYPYYQWDNYKTRGCICDPGFGDIDCSKRLCDYGTDIMDQRDQLNNTAKYQVQQIQFAAYSGALSSLYGKTFAFRFTNKLNETYTTIPINFYSSVSDFRDFILDVRKALTGLPNRVIDNVDVSGVVSGSNLLLNVTFNGANVQGPQNLLTVVDYECQDGCSPKIDGLELAVTSNKVWELQSSDFNSYECGRRGKCDYETGICQCFAGYMGPTCGTISCLV